MRPLHAQVLEVLEFYTRAASDVSIFCWAHACYEAEMWAVEQNIGVASPVRALIGYGMMHRTVGLASCCWCKSCCQLQDIVLECCPPATRLITIYFLTTYSTVDFVTLTITRYCSTNTITLIMAMTIAVSSSNFFSLVSILYYFQCYHYHYHYYSDHYPLHCACSYCHT